jgi:hypothetical protein
VESIRKQGIGQPDVFLERDENLKNERKAYAKLCTEQAVALSDSATELIGPFPDNLSEVRGLRVVGIVLS